MPEFMKMMEKSSSRKHAPSMGSIKMSTGKMQLNIKEPKNSLLWDQALKTQ
jgi:hypothetical protein